MKSALPGILISTSFFILYTVNSLTLHYSFNTSAYDLGYYTQAIYLYSLNDIYISSYLGFPVLGDHVELILWLLSRFYFIMPKAELLLIFQSMSVSLSAIPLYAIAQHLLVNYKRSTILIITYLSSIGIVNAMNFDFHPATASVLPIALVLFFLVKKNALGTFFSIGFAFLFKEDVPILTALLGVWQFYLKRYKTGLIICGMSGIMLFLMFKVILPTYAPLGNSYDTIYKPGINALLAEPSIKLSTFIELHANYVLLPMLNILSLIVVLPMLILRFVIPYENIWTNLYHHSASIQPVLVVATMYGIKNWENQKLINIPTRWLLCGMMLISITNIIVNVITPTTQNIYSILNGQYEYIVDSLKVIPSDAKIAAQSPIAPHLSNRKHIVMFPDIKDAEYVILDETLNRHPLYDDLRYFGEKKRLIQNEQWVLIHKSQSLEIYQRTVPME